MNTSIDQSHAATSAAASSPAHQAYRILHFGFTVAPIRRFGQVLPPPSQLGPIPSWSRGEHFARVPAQPDAYRRRD